MLAAVGFAIDLEVLQPEISRKVDHFDAVFDQVADDLDARVFGQAGNHHFGAALDEVGTQFLKSRQVQARQMAVNLRHLAPHVMLGGQHRKLHEGMKGEQPNRLDTRVSGCTQDGYLDPVCRAHRNLKPPPDVDWKHQLEHEVQLEANAGRLRKSYLSRRKRGSSMESSLYAGC